MDGGSAKSCVHTSPHISGSPMVKPRLKALLKAQAIFMYKAILFAPQLHFAKAQEALRIWMLGISGWIKLEQPMGCPTFSDSGAAWGREQKHQSVLVWTLYLLVFLSHCSFSRTSCEDPPSKWGRQQRPQLQKNQILAGLTGQRAGCFCWSCDVLTC